MSTSALLTAAFRRPIPSEPEYAKRLETEFALIDHNKFTRVFLQVQRILELCLELKIPHIIRGSAGSSLVCFLMGISHTDPLKYTMDLTRFMNYGRTDLPDIDIDIPYNRRDELYAAIGLTWPGAVARISNHVLFKYKSALQEALRVIAPKAVYRKNASIEDLVRNPEIAAKVHEYVNEITGTLRTESLHCGGIVIFDAEGTSPFATRKEGGAVPADLILKNTGILPQLKLNKDEVEDAGYIKIDLLSSRGLAQHTEIAPMRHVLDYPPADVATSALLAAGNNIGITFGESRGMRSIFKALAPKGVEDISIALALIRPAAAAGGRKAAFLAARRAGIKCENDLERPIVYDDDALARIRAVLNARGELPADSADSMADYFRKGFAKERMADIFRFRDLCRLQGLPEPFIKRILEDLQQLKHYSFCKSHALSYAQLVWALAYEKAHNPHAFWVAALNHCHSDFRKWVHWREARAAGLRLTRGQPPYRLGTTRTGEAAILPNRGEQLILIKDSSPAQIYEDMLTRGYWNCEEFFPGCYKHVRPAPQRRLTRKKADATLGLEEKEYLVEFTGLIACGRVVHSEVDGEESTQSNATFLCVGYDNGKYMDLIVHGKKGWLLGYAAVTGVAKTRHPDRDDGLEVQSIKGVGLRALAFTT
jgi:DNA polymerase III alpha subunit